MRARTGRTLRVLYLAPVMGLGVRWCGGAVAPVRSLANPLTLRQVSGMRACGDHVR